MLWAKVELNASVTHPVTLYRLCRDGEVVCAGMVRFYKKRKSSYSFISKLWPRDPKAWFYELDKHPDVN